MKSKTEVFKFRAFQMLVVILAASAMAIAATAQEQSPKDKVMIIVDKHPNTAGVTVPSGATVSTIGGKSTIVSLGKAGRVVLEKDSKIVLNYSSNFVIGPLLAGRVQVSIPAGVSVNFSTTDGEVITDGAKGSFTIDITCGNTVVTVKTGQVELRADSEAEGKKIVAGATDSIGKPCTRKSAH